MSYILQLRGWMNTWFPIDVWIPLVKKSSTADTKAEEPNLPYYCSIVIEEERIDAFLHFPMAFAWYETQLASFRIWTRFADSISYDDSHAVKSNSQVFMGKRC